MKTILIVNTREKECAVWQYGQNLFHALVSKELFESSQFHFHYCEPKDDSDLLWVATKVVPDAIIYNWHPNQGGFLKDAPFDVGRVVKNLCVFHEMGWEREEKFDAVLFSAHPTSVGWPDDCKIWHRVPLLLPQADFLPKPDAKHDPACPWIGVNGYGGAHANLAMEQIVKEFDHANVCLHLPPAHYGDADGRYARIFAEKCRDLAKDKPGILVHARHDWMDQDDLLTMLSLNDLNLYLRPTQVAWHGVSAAMCAALAVKRPMSTNRNPSFRHLWDCQPSVCVEDRSLKEILATGTKPLEPVWEQNSTEKFVARIEEILGELGV
jgi:hypothetical protein